MALSPRGLKDDKLCQPHRSPLSRKLPCPIGGRCALHFDIWLGGGAVLQPRLDPDFGACRASSYAHCRYARLRSSLDWCDDGAPAHASRAWRLPNRQSGARRLSDLSVSDDAEYCANTSPPSSRARARARGGSENQRPWPADKVERWSIDIAGIRSGWTPCVTPRCRMSTRISTPN